MTYSIKTVDGGRFFFEADSLDTEKLFNDSCKALEMPIKNGKMWINVQNIVSITEKEATENE